MFEDRLHFAGKGYNIPSVIHSYDDEIISFHDHIREDPMFAREYKQKQNKKYRDKRRKRLRSY